MAQSILSKYGIKEVADIAFYELDGTGRPTNPVLYIDTAKVSTMEQTAENTAARGGKGNAELIENPCLKVIKNYAYGASEVAIYEFFIDKYMENKKTEI